ncbi:hypothetical protein FFLO_02337 [Filobasidium floriforme]|uniref:HMG box domain-containing protein n=1 Tax=Filobasidium floriforme TaxID=5210 RepID=A0A8K0JN66_9TREE|nr:uncharacterized protein HD553DRAFT_361635 [Filobasidium floriforme]KAG7562251.1 hypothetical protein FFLO_02337 [Filobasidium floriforme]KAH8080556.1 hypothetical protein HD553DRAFT_361635 [Filobasidium floriforme]
MNRTQLPTLFRGLNLRAQRSITSSPVVNLVNKKFEDAGLPLPPKAPMSSYAFFFTEIYPDIRGSYLNPEGKVDSRAVAKAAGAKWNALSEDEKKPYVQKGKSAQEAYKSSYLKYYNSLSAPDLARLNSILPRPLLNPNLPRTAADGSKLRHNIRNPKKEGEPQRPIGGFFAFMRELREDEGLKKEAEEKGVSKGDMQVWLSKKGGETWATMNDEQKKKYMDQAAAVRSDYVAWKAKQN